MINLNDLTDTFIIANPLFNEDEFHKTVVYICEHNEKGAIGLIVNKALDLSEEHVQNLLSLNSKDFQYCNVSLMHGGPIAQDKGFILYKDKNQPLSEGLTIKQHQHLQQNISLPSNLMLVLGCSSWGAGELEQEIQDNLWFFSSYDEQLLFNTPNEHKWAVAMANLGIESHRISTQDGRA